MNEENKNENKQNAYERPKSHRVLAWIAIFLLFGMYLITFISAITGAGSTSALFMMSLGSTIVLPGLLWLYIRFWKFSMGRDRETFEEEIKQMSGVREGAGMSTAGPAETEAPKEETDTSESEMEDE